MESNKNDHFPSNEEERSIDITVHDLMIDEANNPKINFNDQQHPKVFHQNFILVI